jgi:hypothetical protein
MAACRIKKYSLHHEARDGPAADDLSASTTVSSA